MKHLATLVFGFALCGIFYACGSDGGTSSSEDNNPEFESSSSADENLSSSQNLITSSSTGTSTEKLSSAKLENSSSSSVFNKSSSSVSSDSNPADGLNSDGIFTDSRDGRAYKTVKIGNQVWMAENLNYAYNYPTATLDSSSVCYENNSESCAQFGRLYLWSAAMDSAAVFGTAAGIAVTLTKATGIMSAKGLI